MNDNKKTRAPKLRFPGFTDDWEQHKLGDLVEKVKGNDGRMNLPTLTISAGNGWMTQEDRFSSMIAGKEKKNYTLLKKGELSYNHGNSKLAKYGAVFELKDYDEALVPKVYHSFKTNDNVSSSFIERIFETKMPDRELAKLITSGARMDGLLNINFEAFISIKVKLPSYEEQYIIADFFELFNSLIALQQRKIEHLKEKKKGLLQKMFPKNGESIPELRFPGFTEAWEQHKLGEIAKIVGGGTPSTANPNYWDGDVNWYSPAEIGGENIVYESNRKISEEGLKKSSAKILPAGTILFTSRAGIGNTAILGKEATTNQGFQSIVPNNKLLDSYFIYSRTNELKQYGEKTGAGSTFVEVSGKQMAKMPLFIPKINEQKKIGSFFRQLDNLITLQQRKLEHLELLKKGLLQQMFI